MSITLKPKRTMIDETLDDKKVRLAQEFGLEPLAKPRKIVPVRRSDGTFKINRAVISTPFVGEYAIGRVLRTSGLIDLVPMRWDKEGKHYNVIRDENAIDGAIIEFEHIYGKESKSDKGGEGEAHQ